MNFLALRVRYYTRTATLAFDPFNYSLGLRSNLTFQRKGKRLAVSLPLLFQIELDFQ